ncbi:MAG: GNAT family N-acetyltransferase [Methanobacteriota archaeon]|nr:MAG: GNAT family N-acetyltransferase [Euryarchaeota archaeon]
METDGGHVSDQLGIRTARIGDLDGLARMWEKLAEYHVELGGPEYRLAPRWRGEWQRFARNHIGRKDRLCLTAEIDGVAVGFLLAAILQRPKVFAHRAYGHIYDVFVEEGNRKQGTGEALVDAAMDWFRAHGVNRVELYTHAKNALGLRFWRKMRFETTVHIMDRRI